MKGHTAEQHCSRGRHARPAVALEHHDVDDRPGDVQHLPHLHHAGGQLPVWGQGPLLLLLLRLCGCCMASSSCLLLA
jgi:hypothetical protein